MKFCMESGKMNITEIKEREAELFRCYGGYIPEAHNEWNDLQRARIDYIKSYYGSAFIGTINHNYEIQAKDVLTEYTGQRVLNFGADFVVPWGNDELAELIEQWNKKGKNKMGLTNLDRIFYKVKHRMGYNLLWR